MTLARFASPTAERAARGMKRTSPLESMELTLLSEELLLEGLVQGLLLSPPLPLKTASQKCCKD